MAVELGFACRELGLPLLELRVLLGGLFAELPERGRLRLEVVLGEADALLVSDWGTGRIYRIAR